MAAHRSYLNTGPIYQLVPDNKKVWSYKCGELKTDSILNPSTTDKLKNDEMNHVSISIMSINNGREPFTSVQVEKNIYLCTDLIYKYHINPRHVIALSDWTLGDSIAPGPYFPWQKFAAHGIGLWSNIVRKDNPDMIMSHLPSNNHITYHREKIPALLYKFNKLGMRTSPNSMEEPNYSQLQINMLKFNLHFLGPQIIANPELKKLYDEVLYRDPGELYAKARLASWDENSNNILNDLLGVAPIENVAIQWDAANYMAFC
ncbi:N-acetylmuramoyl-L-alanine amidase [Candidatus Tisiphia endosymbiont of Nemotelus uliginosus]|uniref:N-acetylmuramoyl-L-alanine amidase n=1 Tax=Candidatus Tisiphia endosymbiont of Nemotelus uliginosus TaxID=3077926 RepID=UPI0035C934B2